MWTLHDGTYGATVAKILKQAGGLVTFEDDTGQVISIPVSGDLQRRAAGTAGKQELARVNMPHVIVYPDNENKKPRWLTLIEWKDYVG